jgi:hypothetical protein
MTPPHGSFDNYYIGLQKEVKANQLLNSLDQTRRVGTNPNQPYKGKNIQPL